MRFLTPLVAVVAFIPLSGSGPAPRPGADPPAVAEPVVIPDWVFDDEQFARRYCVREYERYRSSLRALRAEEEGFPHDVARVLARLAIDYRDAEAGRVPPDDVPQIWYNVWVMPFHHEEMLGYRRDGCEFDRLALKRAVHERREKMLMPILLGRR